MESSTRKKCIECASPKEVEHPMVTFSQRVRSTCGWKQNSTEANTTIVTLISRKPYTRWKGDAADKNFHRVLENEDELVAALESASKNLKEDRPIVADGIEDGPSEKTPGMEYSEMRENEE